MKEELITTLEAHKILEKLSEQINISTEYVSIENCLNRVLAVDIFSYDDIPQFNKSAVDGYAIASKYLEETPKIFKVDGEVSIKNGYDKKINLENCVYVPTGALVPEEYDCMVMVEDTILNDDKTITILNSPMQKNLIIFKGDEHKKNELAIKKNTKISPYVISSLAFFGYKEVLVYKKLTLSIISTGDELVEIDKKESIFEVRDVNSYTLSALAKNINVEVVSSYVVKDDLASLKNIVKKAGQQADLVFLSGGSSVGKKDYTFDILSEISTVLINGIKMKPGKPTIISKNETTTFIGLPGHPMSASVVFKILIEPLINKIYKIHKPIIPKKAILTKDCYPAIEKELYQMVELVYENEKLYAIPIFTKSGFIGTMQKADGYFIIPLEKPKILKGEEVFVFDIN